MLSACYHRHLPQWRWLYLLSGPALYLRVGERVFLMRKALSNLPPIFWGTVSTDVSGSFFTLPMTQRPLCCLLDSSFQKSLWWWTVGGDQDNCHRGEIYIQVWKVFFNHTVSLQFSKKVCMDVYFQKISSNWGQSRNGVIQHFVKQTNKTESNINKT